MKRNRLFPEPDRFSLACRWRAAFTRDGTSKCSRETAAFFPAGDSPSESRPPADRTVILGRASAQRGDSRGSSASSAEGAKHFRVFDSFALDPRARLRGRPHAPTRG